MALSIFIFIFFSFISTSKSNVNSKSVLLTLFLVAALCPESVISKGSHEFSRTRSEVSDNKIKCDTDSKLQKYFYFVKKLEIDVSGEVPFIQAFDIFAVSNAGLESGWAKMESYSIPIHFVYLDVQNSNDFYFITQKDVEPQTNLEHPGYFYKRKIGVLMTVDFRIDKIRFAYDRHRKIIYNANEGIIGQTRFSHSRDSFPERPFLRISIKSEKTSTYFRFKNNKKHSDYMNTFNKQSSINRQRVPKYLEGRPVRVDYADDPDLTQLQFSRLSLLDKFIYKFLHGRDWELTDDQKDKQYEQAWRAHAKKEGLAKYKDWLYFEFTTTNPGENMPSFGDSEMTIHNIQKMFRFAHEHPEKRLACLSPDSYPYRGWTRMPNDFCHDEELDRLNQRANSQAIFEGLSLRDIFGEQIIPSENFFGVPEPNWTNNQMQQVYEAGIYTEHGVLTRNMLRNEHDQRFKDKNWEKMTWFPFRVLEGDSQVINILKRTMSPFSSMSLNMSVDQYGLVLYSKDQIATSKYEKKMLWDKFQHILFDDQGNSLVFMGKVLGFISFEKIKQILLIGSRRGFNYNGFLKLSEELTALMERGFGHEEYNGILQKLFKNEQKQKKEKDIFNEKKLQMLF